MVNTKATAQEATYSQLMWEGDGRKKKRKKERTPYKLQKPHVHIITSQ